MRKKSYLSGMIAVITILLIGSFYSSCNNDPGGTPKGAVISVTILQNGNPVNAIIKASKGSTLTFTADVIVKNNAEKTVKWSLSGGSAGTTLNAGELVIAATEADDAELEVTATSTVDSSRKDTITVKVLSDNAPVIKSVTISADDDATSVEKGSTLQFTVVVDAENGAAEDVLWTITSEGHAAGTEIDQNGLLTIDADENQASITVKAASKEEGFEGIADTITVMVNAISWPENTIFYDGELSPFVVINGWETDVTVITTETGHDNGTGVIQIAAKGGEWGKGFGMDLSDDNVIDLNEVDALSFWIKADGTVNIQEFGLGDNSPEDRTHHILYTGENNAGIEIDANWQRIVIPIPKRMEKTITNVLHMWITASGNSIPVYIDDIEFIVDSEKSFTINIPGATSVSPNASPSIVSLLGDYYTEYTIDGVKTKLFATQTKFENWFTITYEVNGDAIQNDSNLEAEASGNFTLKVIFDGDKESNVMNGTIILPSSTIINDFSNISSQIELANNASVQGYRVSGDGQWWWGGLIVSATDNNSPQVTKGPALQAGAAGDVFAQRHNYQFDFINDITQFKDSHPIVSFWVLTRGAQGSNNEVSFQLRTGNHTSATQGFTAWDAPVEIVARPLGPFGQYNDYESGWVQVKIPLNTFTNNGNPITDETSIVITGWQIGSNAMNLFVSNIELIDTL